MIADVIAMLFIAGWGVYQVWASASVLTLPDTWAYRSSHSTEAKIQGAVGIAAFILVVALILT